MPRQARIEYHEGHYHIINRGIERRKIVRNSRDYAYFIKCLSNLLIEEKHDCHVWVLMPNHFHLFIRRSVNPVGRLMSRLQTGYAGYCNRKYHRAGRLFQNRYKAILCDEETYFKELVAYIHLNPFRAGMVKEISELDSFPWSGHGGLVGKANYPWMAVDEVIVRFGSTPKTARQGYRAFLRERAGKEINLSGGGLIGSAGGLRALVGKEGKDSQEYDSRLLGDGEFVRKCLEGCDEPMRKFRKRFRKQTRYSRVLSELWG